MGNSFRCTIQAQFAQFRNWTPKRIERTFDKCIEIQGEVGGFGYLITQDVLRTLLRDNDIVDELWELFAQKHGNSQVAPLLMNVQAFLGAILVICHAKTSTKVRELYKLFDTIQSGYLDTANILRMLTSVSFGVSKFSNSSLPSKAALEALAQEVDTLLQATCAEQIADVPIITLYLKQFRHEDFGTTLTAPLAMLPPVHVNRSQSLSNLHVKSPTKLKKFNNGISVTKMPSLVSKRLNASRIRKSKSKYKELAKSSRATSRFHDQLRSSPKKQDRQRHRLVPADRTRFELQLENMFVGKDSNGTQPDTGVGEQQHRHDSLYGGDPADEYIDDFKIRFPYNMRRVRSLWSTFLELDRSNAGTIDLFQMKHHLNTERMVERLLKIHSIQADTMLTRADIYEKAAALVEVQRPSKLKCMTFPEVLHRMFPK